MSLGDLDILLQDLMDVLGRISRSLDRIVAELEARDGP
jgi:hypothetical protein